MFSGKKPTKTNEIQGFAQANRPLIHHKKEPSRGMVNNLAAGFGKNKGSGRARLKVSDRFLVGRLRDNVRPLTLPSPRQRGEGIDPHEGWVLSFGDSF